jgi:phosphoenolpyruvate carboxykinase (GTP)
MFERNKGIDIVCEIGKVANTADAQSLFETVMDSENLAKMGTIKNPEAVLKIANAIAMCNPEKVFVNSGSDHDVQFVRDLSISNGEEAELALERHTLHYDLKEEQGRIIDRTYYIVNDDELVSSLAQKILRNEALTDVRDKMAGIMQGMMMVVGFYNRGPVGAFVSNPALEITSSAYVAHSANILYRNVFDNFDREVDRAGHFYTNIHSQGHNRPEDLPHARVYMDRSHWTTYSVNCTYAGNTLLLKKGNHRFSVDKAIYFNRGNELSEHMFITGVNGPGGRVTWVTGAAPSGCGKTTTAMAGDHFVGDDLAQMWIAEDGTVRSINPEKGIFGILEDVNWNGDPRLMENLRRPGAEVIWSNVLVDDHKIPHWTNNGETIPDRGINFQGSWQKGMTAENGDPVPISHPNARCTIAASALSNCSELLEDPRGVETRVITYSGRDSNTMPPVWVAKNSDHGVVIGATIVSAATATEVGATGVKRSPWANAPFIPGALADYMEAQFSFFGSDAIAEEKRPIIAGLNYFLTEEARGGTSKKLLGEKRDVKVWLGWLERRVHREVEAIETPIGLIPTYSDLADLFQSRIGKTYTEELYNKQFSFYIDNIIDRIDMQLEAYGKEQGLPDKLFGVLYEQRQGLLALKKAYGPVVTPSQLLAFSKRS